MTYAVGIDLGTTNSVVAFAPLGSDTPAAPTLLPVPQLVGPGTVEPRPMLPSYLYAGTTEEAAAGTLDLPWAQRRDWAVGAFARRQAADVPARTVAATKSWLAYPRVDRRQPILPWGAPAEVAKVSPVEASRRFLEHLAAVWAAAVPEAPLERQQVVLTVPASFDASARELTRDAALSHISKRPALKPSPAASMPSSPLQSARKRSAETFTDKPTFWQIAPASATTRWPSSRPHSKLCSRPSISRCVKHSARYRPRGTSSSYDL